MIEKVNALIKVNATRKGIVITDHNYENVIDFDKIDANERR
jgi:PHD/YefM family antitoxin component YafN of YafNO toxin-antitoxin module